VKTMIQPAQSNRNFLDDVQAAARRNEPFHLWWTGQSGFLLQWEGRHLLFDPYLSDSLTEKYAETDKPHVRMTERVIDPARLDFIDVATSTHNHTDHLDAETLGPLLHANPDMVLVIPEANRDFVATRLGVDPALPVGIDDGSSAEADGFVLHGVPAAHENVERDDLGRCTHLGYVVEFGPWAVYHAGDTVRFDGMAARLLEWRIDVAILPINGRAPERRVAGNLSGEEAAQLGADIGARVVIPCHYEMFEFNTASPEPFRTAAQRLGQRAVVLENGGRWSCDLTA
jgi:L-ascorbate metabolism protein UlaG (beta-lactamase superfamily)